MFIKKIRKSEDQNTVCSIDQFNYRNNYIVYLSVIGLILNVIIGFLFTTMFISRDTYFRFDAGQKCEDTIIRVSRKKINNFFVPDSILYLNGLCNVSALFCKHKLVNM